jgi:hypothetical protein
LNPSAALLETGDGFFCIAGENGKKRFVDGIKAYLLCDVAPKFKENGQQLKIFAFGDNWKNEMDCCVKPHEILITT